MEEAWDDINLTSLNSSSSAAAGDHHHHHLSLAPNKLAFPPPHHHSNPNFVLQDFFSGGRPPRRDPPSRICSGHPDHTASTTAVSLLPPPPTVLSLNSTPPGRFDFLDNSSSEDLTRTTNNSNSSHFKNTTPIRSNVPSAFDGMDSSPPCNFPSFGKRRIQESNNDTSSGDRRHKRMIKNRESAARSRARKQAYTQELENAVNQLNEENARLKKQHEKLYMAAASQLPKKNTLHRTSTAPF